MNIAPLFKRFDELADAPERIPALRKVILAYLLHSAVNSPDAISRAATLREAHETRRRELIKSASRKEVPTVSNVVDEDLPPSLSDIPAVLFDRLGNIASIEKGVSQIQSTTPGKYPLVVTAETRSSSDSFDFEGAAAIIPLVSSTGHGDASLKRIHYQEGRYAVGNILAVVKPICPDLLRARFIYEYLSAFKEELLVSRMVGTANVSLTVNKLKEVPVPLVSGPVLSRIDELMALCDRLEAQQQERETRHAALARASLARFADAPTPANLPFLFHPSYAIPPADLRKSILTLAVQGKLVPQDPNDEPAEELLGRIDSSRNLLLKAGVVPKQKPLAEIGEAECQHSIPESWQWIRLQRAAEIIDPNPSHRMPRYCASGVPFISTENFVGREEIDFSIGKQVDQAQLEEQTQGFTIRPGSFALSRIGTIGKTRMLPLERNYCMSHALVVIAPYSADIDSKFLRMVVSSDAVQGQASHGAKSIGVPDLGMGKIRSFVVPLPPLAEQRRIVAKVEQLMALVDALETHLAASRATAANVLSALVAELTQQQ